MSKTSNFFKRNFKELLRDPLIYVFCLGFPIIMILMFQIISKYTGGNTPMFNMRSLLPAIIMFSYTFVMLTMVILVSKDRQTFFLKRLYSSPMKASNYIFGYALVGFIIGLCQTIICIICGLIITLITNTSFLSSGQVLLLITSQLPMLITNIFLGILLGTLFSDKAAPGICSIFINLAGMLGGCWMPLETMGNFETFCRWLPFYPSVYVGRIITNATSALNTTYTFDNTAKLGLIPIFVFMAVSILGCVFTFKKSMVSDNN